MDPKGDTEQQTSRMDWKLLSSGDVLIENLQANWHPIKLPRPTYAQTLHPAVPPTALSLTIATPLRGYSKHHNPDNPTKLLSRETEYFLTPVEIILQLLIKVFFSPYIFSLLNYNLNGS